jgi:hypothetical protein
MGLDIELNLHVKNWKVLKGNFIYMNINALYMNIYICLTRLCVGSYGVLIPEEVKHFLFSLKLAPVLWPIKTSNKIFIVAISPGRKRPEREAKNLPLFCAVKSA